ncbi:MAG: sodium-dependent transporter [Deltaproteobacteria bacterium]|nr:sodium-dependent transporter [Deltaproteobacteria bacterium]
MASRKRDSWASRLGIIMAVAGSAIGLGNFLRFPAKAAANGGGAFMIPYLVALLLLGLPLMWVEWTLGRFGGGFEHGTAPGIFHNVWRKNRFIKYFGVIGIFGPLVIFIYYVYIASWTLGYSFYSLNGTIASITDQQTMQSFLRGYQGIETNQFFSGIWPAYICFFITFIISFWIIYHGIRGGIERICRIAVPLLFGCALILFIRVLTLGTPNPEHPDWNISNGFGFLWNPDFSALKSGKVWIEAAGQIFFTLSVGIGVILTYASYLSKGDDVTLSGLSATSMNETAEVILGGSIIIPAAFVFFGPTNISDIAASGVFNIGFVTMPLILNQLPLAGFLGFLWFFLLFLAGITSLISIMQPAIAFLEDEFNINRKKAVFIFGSIAFILCHFPIFMLQNGVVDELDFWGGTFFLVLFATIEVILFAWILGIDKAWDEMHHGADLRVPKAYKFIIKYVTPVFLLIILSVWLWQEWLPVILMKNVSDTNKPFVLGTRIVLMVLLTILAIAVKIAWSRRKTKGEDNYAA